MKSLDNPFGNNKHGLKFLSDFNERDEMYFHRGYKISLSWYDVVHIGPGLGSNLSLDYTGTYIRYLGDMEEHDVSVIDSRFNSLDVISNEEGLNARM